MALRIGTATGNGEYYRTQMARYGLSVEGHYIRAPKRTADDGGWLYFQRTGRDAESWIDGWIAARQASGDYGKDAPSAE